MKRACSEEREVPLAIGAGPVVTLEMLRVGEKAVVVDLWGDPTVVARLEERGLRVGGTIELLTVGDPLVVRLESTKLSFRTNGAASVLVQPIH
ncbi:MAG: FeoA family protein [Planctomycetia bacterium]